MFSIDSKWKTTYDSNTLHPLTWNASTNLCSFADGQAWFGNTGRDFSSFANSNRMVILRDSSGRLAWGYLGAAGPGITYSERIANGDLSTATGWDTDKDGSTGTFTISGGVATATGATRLISQDVLSLKKTYRHSFDLTSYTSGVFYQYVGIGSQGRTANGSYVAHLCATNSIHAGVYAVTATGVVDNISVQEMLTPPSTGLYVYKDAARTTQGWNMEASFGLNGTSYTFDVVGDCSIEGTVVLDWVPGFSMSNMSSSVLYSILSTGSAGELLRSFGTTWSLYAWDNTNLPNVLTNHASGDNIKAILRFSSKTRTYGVAWIKNGVLTTTTHVTFDGAFSLSTLLKLHESNAMPAKYSNLRIYNRVLTDAELSRLS
jgi:hypothetical protein